MTILREDGGRQLREDGDLVLRQEILITLFASQTLSAVTQTATTAAPTVRALTANQNLRAVTQMAAAQPIPVPADSTVSAAQTLLPVAFASSIGVVPLPAPPPAPTPIPPSPVEEPSVSLAAKGDLEDMVARQAAVLPPWFGPPGTAPPVLRLPLLMAASVASWLYGLIAYAKKQTRIKTATGGWLDLIAFDFFGRRIRRRSGQTDDAFRTRILVELFRPRGTRPAMAAILRDLTGREPRIFEPQRPADVGGIGIDGGMGIGVAGAIGSLGVPGEVFIDVFRSPDAGIPYAAGIGIPVGGIGVPSRLVIASLEQIRGALRDVDVYDAVEATRPVGITTWVRISL